MDESMAVWTAEATRIDIFDLMENLLETVVHTLRYLLTPVSQRRVDSRTEVTEGPGSDQRPPHGNLYGQPASTHQENQMLYAPSSA